MKLIIDIDKQHFELLQVAVASGMGDNVQKIIVQGIPLDNLRAEIDAIETHGQIDEHTLFIRSGQEVKKLTLEIIDKYRNEVDE